MNVLVKGMNTKASSQRLRSNLKSRLESEYREGASASLKTVWLNDRWHYGALMVSKDS